MANKLTTKVSIIAEAGVNHNGDVGLALELVDVAAMAGADIVKFQTFKADSLVTRKARKARYQVENTGIEDATQLAMLQALELSAKDFLKIVERCQRNNIEFMSTAFDEASLHFLSELSMPAIKIASGDATCGPMLLAAAHLRRPIFLSTGMCNLAEVEQALEVLAFGLTNDGSPTSRADLAAAYRSEEGQSALLEFVTVLHCTSQYPAAPAAVNLRAIQTLEKSFGLRVGYSDHTLGDACAIAAVALGATVIEKHFTLEKTMEGPDHAASLDPLELSKMVGGIRILEEAMGSAIKRPGAAELDTREVARRSIVAAVPIASGTVLTRDMLTTKRPGDGISPMEIWELDGRVASRDYEADDQIRF